MGIQPGNSNFKFSFLNQFVKLPPKSHRTLIGLALNRWILGESPLPECVLRLPVKSSISVRSPSSSSLCPSYCSCLPHPPVRHSTPLCSTCTLMARSASCTKLSPRTPTRHLGLLEMQPHLARGSSVKC